jgi:hypothetical protein
MPAVNLEILSEKIKRVGFYFNKIQTLFEHKTYYEIEEESL